MVLENQLGIADEAELARAEEKISKEKALELFEKGMLDTFGAGTFQELARIHGYLFGEIYAFAGKIRTVNCGPSLPGGKRKKYADMAGCYIKEGIEAGGELKPRRSGGLSSCHGTEPNQGCGDQDFAERSPYR